MLLNMCTVEHLLQIGSAVFGWLAAWRWFVASLENVPAQMTWENIDDVYSLIAEQSRLNAQAALFAGIAAVLQLSRAFMPTC
jgi:hypothetical protein